MAYKSLGTKKIKDFCVSKKTLVEYNDALAILEARYGSNFLAVENSEFKIEEWQAGKKIEHAVYFGIKPEDFDFSQQQAKVINAPGGVVSYVRKGQKLPIRVTTLPSLNFIRAYQTAIKKFCEDTTQSTKNDESTF